MRNRKITSVVPEANTLMITASILRKMLIMSVCETAIKSMTAGKSTIRFFDTNCFSGMDKEYQRGICGGNNAYVKIVSMKAMNVRT